ncbi:hypothetical protein VNO78_12793 [Psophocarpus tetragonolobus]|uniref:VQ domain-containing protein n=1 Tax=Psophocarpus tetragonolobus TaxID=3891 RepID=A0AAN9SPF7_PSOTE
MKREGQGKKNGNNHKKDVKVKYISSPMKVKTSASNFRALVQELTGQASNVAERFVEDNYDGYGAHHHDGIHKSNHHQQRNTSEAYLKESTTWLKHDDYSHLYSRSSYSSMEPLNGAHLQYELLSFDTM